MVESVRFVEGQSTQRRPYILSVSNSHHETKRVYSQTPLQRHERGRINCADINECRSKRGALEK
jgi:hypothetical protein